MAFFQDFVWQHGGAIDVVVSNPSSLIGVDLTFEMFSQPKWGPCPNLKKTTASGIATAPDGLSYTISLAPADRVYGDDDEFWGTFPWQVKRDDTGAVLASGEARLLPPGGFR